MLFNTLLLVVLGMNVFVLIHLVRAVNRLAAAFSSRAHPAAALVPALNRLAVEIQHWGGAAVLEPDNDGEEPHA